MKLFARKYSYISGFTLAEVLITLLIIGVVASLVIPAIINDTQEAEYKAAWKKAYAEVDQATRFVMMDNGGTLKGVFTTDQVLTDKYLGFMSYTKKCPLFSVIGNCWHNNNTFKDMSGSPLTWTNYSGAILNNGSLFYIALSSTECDFGSMQRCGMIFIDVNGFKSPNVIGKDIFGIHILKNTIIPYGAGNDSDCNTNPPSGSGYGCAARYLYQ